MTSHSLPAVLTGVLLSVPAAASGTPARGVDASPADPVRDPTRIASMQVDIWPEYDDPRVLVIYRGSVDPGTALPAGVSFVVPEGAQIHMAGGLGPNGEHIHAEFGSVARPDGRKQVTWDLEVPDFYMEFYYDPFSGGEERSFTYPVLSPHRVGSLVVSVQQPRRAEDFAVQPFTAEVLQDDRGFPYHVVREEDVAAGETRPITVRYRKADDVPSVEPEATAGEGSGSPAAPWGNRKTLAVLLGALGLGALAYGFILPRGTATFLEEEPRPSSDGTAFEEPLPRRFCTECGEPVAETHRFCGACGAPTGLATVPPASVVG